MTRSGVLILLVVNKLIDELDSRNPEIKAEAHARSTAIASKTQT